MKLANKPAFVEWYPWDYECRSMPDEFQQRAAIERTLEVESKGHSGRPSLKRKREVILGYCTNRPSESVADSSADVIEQHLGRIQSICNHHFSQCLNAANLYENLICDCADECRGYMLETMAQIGSLRDTDWCTLCVASAMGNPWLSNYVTVYAQSESEFGGIQQKCPKGDSQMQNFYPELLAPKIDMPPPNHSYLTEQLRKFWEARGLMHFMQEHYASPVMGEDGWLTYVKKIPSPSMRIWFVN